MRNGKRMSRAALMVAGALLAVPAAAAAQQPELSIGYGGGYMHFAPFVEQDGVAQDLTLEAGWVATVNVEYQIAGGPVAFRLSGIYTRRPLELPTATKKEGVWGADAGFVLRPAPLSGTSGVSPYFGVDGGMLWYDFGIGPRTIRLAQTEVTYRKSERYQFAVVGVAGFDIYPGWVLLENPLGIRIEAADHYVFSGPFREIGAGEPGGTHNWRVTIGLQSAVARVF